MTTPEEQHIYQALNPQKKKLETKHGKVFEVFELKAVFEGFPPAGYVLQVKAPLFQTDRTSFRELVDALYDLKTSNSLAQSVQSVKILYD